MPTKSELTAALAEAQADIAAIAKQNTEMQAYLDEADAALATAKQLNENTILHLRIATDERDEATANLEGAQRLIAKQLARINELEVQLTATTEDLNTFAERCERAIADANRADAARIEATERANHHHKELVVANKRLANAIGAVHDLARAADPNPLNPVG